VPCGSAPFSLRSRQITKAKLPNYSAFKSGISSREALATICASELSRSENTKVSFAVQHYQLMKRPVNTRKIRGVTRLT
jgi:hypothetical protein